MGKAADIRISDAERDEAMSMLAIHLSTGRLTNTEPEERHALASAARTRGELEALFTDLPAPHPNLSAAIPPVEPGSIEYHEMIENQRETPVSAALDTVAGVCLILGIPAAILLTIFLGMWWLFIPVGVIMIGAGVAAEFFKKPRPED